MTRDERGAYTSVAGYTLGAVADMAAHLEAIGVGGCDVHG